MNCKKVNKYLSEYLEGDLDDRIKREIEEHLSKCLLCSQELETFKSSLNSLKSLEVEDVKGELWFKIKERIQQKENFFDYFYANYLKPLPGLALTVAVIILMLIGSAKIFQRLPINPVRPLVSYGVKREPPKTFLNFVYKEFQDDELTKEIYERSDLNVKKIF